MILTLLANYPVSFHYCYLHEIFFLLYFQQPPKPVNNSEHVGVKKPSAPVKPITPTNNQSKQIQAIKRPAPSVLSPPIKVRLAGSISVNVLLPFFLLLLYSTAKSVI